MPALLSEQALSTIVREVKHTINLLFPPGAKPQRLGLAISGGVDSMALATLTKLAREDPTFQHTFTGFIVDHKLRNESAEEAASVAESLRLLDIKPKILTLDWNSHGNPRELSNFESVARILRYQALGKACAAKKIPYLIFGHHADDQAETVLSRAVNGYTGLGLQGIATTAPIPECEGMYGIDRSGSPRSIEEVGITRMYQPNIQVKRSSRRGGIAIEHGGVSIHRPLLRYTKAQLKAICQSCGTLWREDVTNSDSTLTVRNTIRYLQTGDLLPKALQRSRVLDAADKVRNKKQRIHRHAHLMFDNTPIQLDLRSGKAIATISNNRQDSGDAPLDYHVKAAFLRKLLLLVSPSAEISLQDLDQCIDMVFAASGSLGSPPPSGLYNTQTSGVSVSRVESGEESQQWKVTLQRDVPTRIERTSKGSMQFVHTRGRWSHWLFWDHRFWIRVHEDVVARDWNTTVHVAHLTPESLGQLRTRLKDTGSDCSDCARNLERALSIAPGKERWTVPAVISRSNSEDRVVGMPTLHWGERFWQLSEGQLRNWKWEIRYKAIDFPMKDCHKLIT